MPDATRDGVRRPPAAIVAASVAVTALCVLPLAVIALNAVDVGAEQAWALLWRPRVGELLRNTLSLVALTVPATVAIGVAAAWLVERTLVPAAGLWRVLLVCPLAVPAFVNSYAWISVRPDLDGLLGAAVVTTLSYFPFVFLPVSAILRGLDRSLEDSARSLGHGPWRTFWRVVLPQLRPAASGGALLVALHLLAEFGVLALMRFPTFTTAILEQYEVAFDPSSGSLLAVVLMAMSLGILTLDFLLRGQRRHARVGRGAGSRATPIRLGRWSPVSLVALTSLVAMSLGLPLASIIHWLGLGQGAVDAGDLASTLWGTLRLAAAAALLTTVAAFPIAWLVARVRGVPTLVVERLTYVASSLPGVVIALALVSLAIRYARPAYQTSALLVLAYGILFIPRAMVSIRASMAQAPPELTEAARSLGCGPFEAFRRVLLPLTLPGALAGFALVFIATSTELTATLILAPTGTTTLATSFWSASESLDYAAAAPYAAAMIAVSAPLTWLLLRQPEEEGQL